MTATRKILVTSALPYANNSLHIGHLVEYVQTDIWVRFQRMRGHDCIYVCASDAHGTPTMLRAEQLGIEPEALLERVAAEHKRDFDTFGISVDNYLTTHAPENAELTTEMYLRHEKNGLIARHLIEQAYDEERQMFLPDRYVRGTCPNCGAADQYGDHCEVCSATYTPKELVDPVSVVSGTRPTLRESEHLFFRLSSFEDELKAWIPGRVDAAMARKLDEWFEAGLKDWDISRDAPYFGFPIPGETGKYFYVWFDAPIGYMASFLNLCRSRGLDFDAYWNEGSEIELHHFIGKDIVYFHTLFWPAMLSGAGYRKPTSVFVHGFLTVDGQKMSKSRGTFINAAVFAERFDPDYLRYYYASKLGAAAEDIDLNLADFVAKSNADLVGKLVNIASRCAGFVHKLNGGQLADTLENEELFDEFVASGKEVAELYEARQFGRAMRHVMALADRANQYIDEQKPWILAKSADEHDKVVEVCTLGLNLFRTLIVYLKPVVPGLAERSERFLGDDPLVWADARRPALGRRIHRFERLLERIDVEDAERLVADNAKAASDTQPTADGQSEAGQIGIDDFTKVELTVAKIVAASYVEGADKLLKLELDTGNATRTVFSGIRKAYAPEALIGEHVVLVANLAPRKMRFGVSEGMILAASSEDGGIFLIRPDEGAGAGMKVS